MFAHMPHAVLLTVTHSLKSRHIQFIAIGGTIGTGLFLGIGEALADGGPLSILLGYTLTGVFIFMMMMSLVSRIMVGFLCIQHTLTFSHREKWLRGYRFLAPFHNTPQDTWILPWGLP